MSMVVMAFLVAMGIPLIGIFVTGILRRRAAAQTDANEPDVFASPEADLDPESDTGEPEGWN